MIKRVTLSLLCSFLFFQGYAQNDSASTVIGNRISKDSVPAVSQNQAATKVAMNKRDPVYKIKPGVDIPIIAIGTIWSVYAFTKIYKKTPPTIDQIQNLKTSDINVFDRWAVHPYSKSPDDISYYPFYAAIPLPLVFFLTEKETRSDFAKLTLLYWEAMSITGLLGTGATYNIDRYRPYAYSSATPMNKRTGSIAKNSFFAGHVQVVATPTFFMAKVYADYNPDSKIKWVFYGVASAATVTTAYLRMKAGMHFPTDILLGTVTGSLAGILVPQYHKTKSSKNPAMSIIPYSTGDINGLVLTYKLNK